MKKILSVLFALFLILGLTACGGGESKESGSGSENKDAKQESADTSEKVKVGYVINSLNDTFQTIIKETAEAYAAENNIELIVADSQEDTIKQQDLTKSLIQKGVKGLIVVPTDTSAMDPITSLAAEAKIPLAYLNRNPYAGKENSIPDNVYYVGADEIQAGILQMDFLGNKLNGKGGVAVLMGILGNEGAVKRTEGVESTMKEKYPDMTILAKETGNWQRDQGLSLTENFITTYGDKLSAIAANNDEMALGAIEALKTNDKLGKIMVVGVDATPDAIKSIESGELDATVFQDPKQGEAAIKIIDTVLKGGNVSEKVQYIPFKLVTADNLEEFK